MNREKKQTAVNLIAKTISFGSTMLISFFLTPYIVSKLGKEAYSFYPMANNFTTYMGVITIALNSMASRFITIFLTKGEKEKANTYFVSILYGNIILAAILLIPMTLIVVFLNTILDIPLGMVLSIRLLFSLVFISMLVNLLTNVFGVAVFSQNRLELSAISDIIIGIVRVLLYLVLFLCFTPNIVYVGVVSLVIAALTVAFQFGFTKKLLPDMRIDKKFFDFKAIKVVLSSGVWNSISQIGIVLLSTMGLMLCNKLYGASEGGNYAIALTIPQFMNGIVGMLSSVFMPGLTIKYALGNKKQLIDHVHSAQNVIGFIDNIPIAIFMAVGVNFFALWTPSVDPYKLQKLTILAIGYLLITSVAWPISNLNVVMNNVKVPALVMVGTGLINILLIMLTYNFTNLGIYSIPLGQMILFILNRAFFVGIYTAKKLGEKWYIFYMPILKNLCSAAIIFMFSYLINKAINPQTWLLLFIECAICGVFGLIVNALIIFKPSEIKSMAAKLVKKHR